MGLMKMISKTPGGDEIFCQVCDEHYSNDYEYYCYFIQGASSLIKFEPGKVFECDECSLCLQGAKFPKVSEWK